MNIYRGCEHQCIYCDSRSECYGIEDFRDVLVKVNALELLADELPRKRIKGLIGTGSMSDPYTPVERQYGLTGKALDIIARQRFPVHIITKSDLVLRDIDTLTEINRTQANVTFTITTADDDLALKLEPGAPASSRRYAVLSALAARGIHTGVTLMPVLPYITDTEQNIIDIIARAADHGASYVLAAFGMTMRDRQRAYYYEQLDRLSPGLRSRYERNYGGRYECPAPTAPRLKAVFEDLCQTYHLATGVSPYATGPRATQMTLPIGL
jgi:DNA repair photolyase